jgi:hypothetical protein
LFHEPIWKYAANSKAAESAWKGQEGKKGAGKARVTSDGFGGL